MNRILSKTALALAAAAAILTAQSPAARETEAPSATGTWHYGTELDVLPYATKGYYASLFAARDAWRVRGVAARSNVPAFMVSDGFEDKRTDAYAFLVDRFAGPRATRQEGFWIGGGIELWRNRISREGVSGYTNYSNTVLTAGGGYVWNISRHFYLNPWAGAHLVVGGDRSIDVSGATYQQPRFTPEASVKFGFRF